MRSIRTVAIAFVIALAATPATADISLVENHKTVAVDCARDKRVELMGNHIAVTLAGTCTRVAMTGNHGSVTGSATSVYISGNNNTAAIDAADDITISGNNNTVTWKRGASGPKPKIAASGKENSITQAK
jgi:DUF3060 family protein